MLSYTGENRDEWKSFVESIISQVSKEQGRVILSNDEDELPIVENSDKKLLRKKHILNKYNVGHDVMTLVWDILTKSVDGNQFEILWCVLGICTLQSL